MAFILPGHPNMEERYINIRESLWCILCVKQKKTSKVFKLIRHTSIFQIMVRIIDSLPYLLAVTNAVAYSVSDAANHCLLNQTVSKGCKRAVWFLGCLLFSKLNYLQCAQLSREFGSALHYPGSDNFTIWDAKQQEVHPACRVEPSSANEVSKILNILVDHWCYFSVKGGGHSRNPGDSNSVRGVTVDLDRMRSVDILDNGTKARVGGGANTFQVYQALESRNLSFVGGRVGTVGLGGFTLGGGTSPFSNKYGWALDNVYEYEVCIALPCWSIIDSGLGCASQWYNHHSIRVVQSGPLFRFTGRQ